MRLARPLRLILAGALAAVCLPGAAARAVTLVDSIDAAGDSITRAFNAASCSYGDQVAQSFATGDNHGSDWCGAGSENVFSHAERLECAKGGNIINLNDGSSGATMRGSFTSQATAIRTNLSVQAGPRYTTVFLGHNDACTNTTSKTGNGCGGDQDPNNYCRTTPAAFEREFREGMDQLIQIPSSRVLILALVRVSELCNFGSKSSCGLGFGTSCSFFWQNLTTIFGGSGVCRSLTADCSNTRRIDMYNTVVAYNQILEDVTAEYAAIPAGGTSATGAVKAADVGLRYVESPFWYKFAESDVSCCDCFHPDVVGQAILAQATYAGAQCSAFTPCCAPSADPLTNANCSVADTTSFYPGGFWSGASCGNGVVDGGEQCDLGVQNGAAGTCCTAACAFRSAGTSCRSSTAACDAPETCTGSSATCPADGPRPFGFECRGSAGPCDVAETCNGVSTTCPADGKSTGVCRGLAGPCDVAESCDGVGNQCPPDVLQPSTLECRGQAGVCDVADFCTGTDPGCPADVKSTAPCRAAAGICDVAESCDGFGDHCPADGFALSGTPCRGAAGACDLAESCTGASAACPADAKSTAPCRAAAGTCDLAESCDGIGNDCPADVLVGAGIECRGAAGDCDLAESCTGASAACPTDAKSTAECRASAGDCDVAEVCDGVVDACPADAFVAPTVECRASAGDCDLAETCTGTGAACPADAKRTAECRAAGGDCDVAETCDGVADDCPADLLAPPTQECRASAHDCDAAESCTGVDVACPADGAEPDGTPCDDGDVCSDGDACAAGTCTAAGGVCGDGAVQLGCGEECDDGNTESGDGCSETCSSEFGSACAPTPAVDCARPIAAGKSTVIVKVGSTEKADALGWKWGRGPTTPINDFGLPIDDTSYALCVYAGGTRVASMSIPAGGICRGRPCWTETTSGFTYKNADAAPHGITKLTLRQGLTPGKAKIGLKGKGGPLPLPALPLAPPVVVQLQNGIGNCWEGVFSAPPQRSTETQFKDASD